MCKYLFTVAHGTLSSDHNLTAGVLLDLFGGHTTWTKDPTDEVELQYSQVLTLYIACNK